MNNHDFAMPAYETIMNAKAIDDIPLDTEDWILDKRTDSVRIFRVTGYRTGNVAEVTFENGEKDFYSLADLQSAVNYA